jgi:hypothetical protein
MCSPPRRGLAYLAPRYRNGAARCRDHAIWTMVAPNGARWIRICTRRSSSWEESGVPFSPGITAGMAVRGVVAIRLFGHWDRIFALGVGSLADLPSVGVAEVFVQLWIFTSSWAASCALCRVALPTGLGSDQVPV